MRKILHTLWVPKARQVLCVHACSEAEMDANTAEDYVDVIMRKATSEGVDPADGVWCADEITESWQYDKVLKRGANHLLPTN